MKSYPKSLLSAVALGALMSLDLSTAKADDIVREIRLLKAQIKRLEENVAKQEQQVRRIAKSPKMPPVAETPIVCKDAPCPPPPPPVFVSFANGLQVESWDDAFSFRIGGRVLVDGGVNSQPVEVFPPPGTSLLVGLRPYFPSHAGSGFSNQVGFRQLRLEVLGKAFNDWEYKFQYDFNGAPNGLVVGGIRDAFLAWRYFMPFTFQTGYFFEPDGLERSASSTKYRDFIERSLAGDLLGGNRHIGLAAVTGGDAPGILGTPNWSFKGGIFSTSLEDGNPVAGSVTTNPAGVVTGVNFEIPAGSSSLLGPVAGGHQYWDAAARLIYAPILTEESLLHIGGSFRYQKPNDATAASDDRVLQPGGTERMGANIVGDTLLGTQPLTCWSSPTAQLIGTNCVNSAIDFGVEVVGSYGPFSVQAEYRGMHYDRNASIILWQHAPGGTSVNFSGWYVYAAWYLTGESRAAAYLTYPKEFNQPSGFGQIRILNPVSAGGWGAWEVAARVDELNLNSGGFLVTDLATGFNNPPNIHNIQGAG